MKTKLALLIGLIVCTFCGGEGKTVEEFAQINLESPELVQDQNQTNRYLLTIDKGIVPVGESHEYTVFIKNIGVRKNLKIATINFAYTPVTEKEIASGKNALTFVGPAQYPVEVAPIGAGTPEIPEYIIIKTIYTRFDDTFERTGTLTIKSNSRYDDEITITIRTAEAFPHIDCPAVVDFGQVYAGDAPVKEFACLNTGNANLIVNEFILKGNKYFTLMLNDIEYPISAKTEAGVQLNPPIVIASNTSFKLKMRYAPETGEAATADLILKTNDPAAPDGTRIEFKANSSGPCIEWVPHKVEFGGKKIGQMAAVPIVIKSCGDSPLIITGLSMKEGSSKDFSLDYTKLPTKKTPTPEEPLVVQINESVTVNATFLPDMVNPKDVDGKPILDIGYIVIENNTFNPTLEIMVSGHGVLVECPQPVIFIKEGEEVIPQTVLHLIGDQSEASAGSIKDFFWSVKQPDLSKSSFIPSFKFPNPTFEVNVAGTYKFCLDVCDDSGRCSNDPECNTTVCKEVVVIPDQAIHVELSWDTPNDPNQYDEGPEAGSDLDLHFLHPFATGPDLDNDGKPDGWFDIPYDTFWFNPKPEWGSVNPNINDNPALDRDDTDGAGPENLNLDVPENGRTYKIGVHYWDDQGYGPSTACINIWIWQIHVFKDCLKLYEFDMWEVATIDWPSGAVTKIFNYDGKPKVIPNYVNPTFNPQAM